MASYRLAHFDGAEVVANDFYTTWDAENNANPDFVPTAELSGGERVCMDGHIWFKGFGGQTRIGLGEIPEALWPECVARGRSLLFGYFAEGIEPIEIIGVFTTGGALSAVRADGVILDLEVGSAGVGGAAFPDAPDEDGNWAYELRGFLTVDRQIDFYQRRNISIFAERVTVGRMFEHMPDGGSNWPGTRICWRTLVGAQIGSLQFGDGAAGIRRRGRVIGAGAEPTVVGAENGNPEIVESTLVAGSVDVSDAGGGVVRE